MAMMICVPAEASELSGIRSDVRAYIRGAGGDASLTGDLELVVSELATNVIEHTSSQVITVLVERDEAGWLIQVADVDDVSILDSVSLPPATSLTGRGLFVVRSLVDTLEVVDTETLRAVRCTRSTG
jgi:anti-sigma regulatory factor (Ser/Thr protein kinase)